MSKTALVVAYYFPPLGGGGVQRTTKFVRYLPEFGWNSRVLSVKNPAYGAFDQSLVNDLPGNLPVYRAYAFQPSALYFKQKRYPASAASSPIGRTSLVAAVKRAVRVAGREFLAFTLFPDDKVGWVPAAIKQGQKAIDAGGVDLVYSTSAPYSAHLIAAHLARANNLPWVADFRDPFIGYDTIPAPSPIHAWARRWLERRWIEQARRVISVTPTMTRDFAARYPEAPAEKWVTITNGYDETDFATITPYRSSEHFDIRYIGTFHRAVSPDPAPLLQAIRNVIDLDPSAGRDIRVSFVGQMDQTLYGQLREAADRLELNDLVEVKPPVSHGEAIQLMASSTILLSMLDEKSGTELAIPAKCFEYLCAYRPILAVGPLHGMTYELLQAMDGMNFVEQHDVPSMTGLLKTWLEQWRQGVLPVPLNQGLEQFSRRSNAAKLAQVLDAAITLDRRSSE